MATHVAQSPAREANAISMVAAEAGGDDWLNNGGDLLLVKHGDDLGSDVTLTVAVPKTVDGQAVDAKEITVAAGSLHALGPWPANIYNDGDGKVALAWSDPADITLAVVRT